MIIAEGFNRSATARDSDFSTAEGDSPLVVQFAASVPDEFAAAAAKAEPYETRSTLIDAHTLLIALRFGVAVVDLNCGCPQSWAMQDGIGARLSSQPEIVSLPIAPDNKKLRMFDVRAGEGYGGAGEGAGELSGLD